MLNTLTQALRGAALVGCLAASALAMPQIDVGLNVVFNNPMNPALGGTWQLVAKSTDQGIASLTVPIANLGTATQRAPRGTINSNDIAGFGLFTQSTLINGQYNLLAMAQTHVPTTGEQAGHFYGVGTLQNGSPQFSGKPAGSNSIGPTLTLTNVTNLPWATGDIFGETAWNTAAIMASGTFASGYGPSFQPEVALSGSVYKTLGTATTVGDRSGLSDEIVLTAILRTNLMSADYNRNGAIDAADYTVWRDTLGATVSPGTGADGSRNGVIDQADYAFWVAAWPTNPPAVPASAALSSAIPEPNALVSAALAAGATLVFLKRTGIFRGKTSGF